MRRIIGFILIIATAIACNKVSSTPTTTAAEIFERDMLAIDTYLTANNIDAIKHESGVRIVFHTTGTGPSPTHENCVRFLYEGYELNNPVAFDSNTTTGFKTPVINVVVGMEILLKMMPLGSKADVYIPSVYGYGVNGVGQGIVDGKYVYKINPSTPIVFKNVEILQIYGYNTLGNYCNE